MTARRHTLVLRTCAADMSSHGGFVWPEAGPVECPDWDPTPKCGNGLHGLAWGTGDATMIETGLDRKWLVVKVRTSDVVDIDGDKVKFPRGEVVHCGDQLSATSYLVARAPAGTVCPYATVVAGTRGTATAGYAGTATAGTRGTATAGYAGTATAGDAGTATAGDGGTATAGYAGTATAGYAGTATAGDAGTATAGDEGTATAGYRGTATAGTRGTLAIWHWDGKRRRLMVGYVGENGIEPNVPYRLDDEGRFVRADA